MARFDIFRNPDGPGYLLCVQADLLDHLDTRVVVPLILAAQGPKPAATLNPVFRIERSDYVMATQFIATVPRTILKKPVGSLTAHHIEIVTAIDLLMQGF